MVTNHSSHDFAMFRWYWLTINVEAGQKGRGFKITRRHGHGTYFTAVSPQGVHQMLQELLEKE